MFALMPHTKFQLNLAYGAGEMSKCEKLTTEGRTADNRPCNWLHSRSVIIASGLSALGQTSIVLVLTLAQKDNGIIV